MIKYILKLAQSLINLFASMNLKAAFLFRRIDFQCFLALSKLSFFYCQKTLKNLYDELVMA